MSRLRPIGAGGTSADAPVDTAPRPVLVGLVDAAGAPTSVHVRSHTDEHCDGTSAALWLGRAVEGCVRFMDRFSAPACGPMPECGT